MKNNFLTLALEEVGLVEPAVEPTTASEQGLEELLEAQVTEDREVVDKAEELDAVEEVQAGLEALVSSMEAALADPNYSAREYQLQVSHAATLLGRIGLGLPAGLSCESTDGAEAAKDSFADKAKKLGKVVLEYIVKFLEWIKDTLKNTFARSKAVFAKIKSGKAFSELKNKLSGPVEFEIDGGWDGYIFDPKDPLAATRAVANVLEDFNGVVMAAVLHDIVRAEKISDSLKNEDWLRIMREFGDRVEEMLSDTKQPYDLSIKKDEANTYITIQAIDGIKVKIKAGRAAIDTVNADSVLKRATAAIDKLDLSFSKNKNILKAGDMRQVIGATHAFCAWGRRVLAFETKVSAMFATECAK